jgi:hypothetical protein
METVTRPPLSRPIPRGESAAVAWLRRYACSVTAAAIYATMLGVSVAAQFVQDSWLSLAGGRDIAQHGLPWHERLTTLTAGEGWADQQWLGKLFLYGLSSVGGLRLVALGHLLFVLAACCAAFVVARRRGASDTSVLWVAVAFLASAPWGWQLRTQTLVYILFVGVLVILTSERIRPLYRVLACAPLLVLWANMHGSVTLGAALVGCFAVLELRRRQVLAGFAGLALPAACLFASPYGFHLAHYYRSLLGNPSMSHYIQEWQAPTVRTATVFFVLAAAVLWLGARYGAVLTGMERCALLLTGVTGLLTIRGIVWFWLAALLLVPKLLDARSTRVSPAPASRPLAAVAAVWACAAVATAAVPLVHLPHAIDSAFPDSAARVVAGAAQRDAGLKVFASERYADWLLWRDRNLAGRMVYDARFELFSKRQFAQLSAFRDQSATRDEITQGARLFVLGFRGDRLAIRSLTSEPGAKVLYRDDELVVILRAQRA